MELKEGDVVSLNSDPNSVFTIGKFLIVDGIKHARVFWFCHLTKDIKVQNVPVVALRT